MRRWQIWFSDGSTVSSEDLKPGPCPCCQGTGMAPASSFIPGFGIEAVAQLDLTPGTGNVGYTVPAGHEWYYWHVQAGEWLGAENDRSILDLLRLRRPIVGVSSGERIPTERYQAILAKARDWAQAKVLPRKSGFRPGEFVP